MLLYSFNCQWLSVPFYIMAYDYPALLSDYIKPVIITHILFESLSLMSPNLEGASQLGQSFRDFFTHTSVEIES